MITPADSNTPDSLATNPTDAALQKKLAWFGTPGLTLEFDPAEADLLGAFHEGALSEADAQAASTDPEVIE